MIKIVPYIETVGNEGFRDFLSIPFTVDMLSPALNENSQDVLFDGWRGKNMLNWYKFTNDENVILEFYPEYYIVKKPVGKLKHSTYQLPLPLTINDFINDMTRFDIVMYWTNWIDINFEPKEYLHRNEIEKYYSNLLIRLGKAHEL